MVYLRTVFALIACKEASLFGVDSCSGTAVSTFYKLREIERLLFGRTAYHGRDNYSTHTRKRGRGASSACVAGRETMGREEIHHLTPRVGVGLWVVAESHAKDGAIGQMHVERVRTARVDHEPEFGRGCGLRGVHLLAKVGWGDGVGMPNEDEQRRSKGAADVRLAPGVQGDTRGKRRGAPQRGPQCGQHRPAAIRHAHHGDMLGVDVGLRGQPGADTVGVVRAPDRPRGHVPGADLVHAAWPEAVHDGRADPVGAEEVGPGADPLRPAGLVGEPPAPVEQDDEGEGARAGGAVQRDRKHPLRRLRSTLFDRTHLKALGVPRTPGHAHRLSR